MKEFEKAAFFVVQLWLCVGVFGDTLSYKHGSSLLEGGDEPMTVHRKSLAVTNEWLRIFRHIERTPSLKQALDERMQQETQRDAEYPFPPFECEPQPEQDPPTSVHALRPADINVVAAIGDSITAGNGLGATNLPSIAYQNRGESWCVGGDNTLEEGVITIPNLLRKFNPNLKGWSRCTASQTDLKYAWLNQAVPGGVSTDMNDQAQILIDTARSDDRIDFDNDWKLVTMFVGGNDLCRSCVNDNYLAGNYVNELAKGIQVLHDGLPRALVNVVAMFDITPLHNMSYNDARCDIIKPLFCPCVMNDTYRPELRPRQMQYWEGLVELIETNATYETSDSFTAVLQPMFRDIVPPIDNATGEYDHSILSYDCFHPARVAHQAFAYMLWNTMLQPVGQKQFTYDFSLPADNYAYSCPTDEQPFIFTNVNSKPDVRERHVTKRKAQGGHKKKIKKM